MRTCIRIRHSSPISAEQATLRTIGQLCQRAEPWLERLDEIGFDRPTTASLRAGVSRRISKLRR